jgi:tripartite-type tricarboxylate transporter receptor subunit TctC
VTTLPLIESGQVRALARMSRRAAASLAGVPVLADAAGLHGFDDLSIWQGLVAPKGTPKPIVDKLNREVVRILNDPQVKRKSEAVGGYLEPSTPEGMTAFMRREAARWEKALNDLGLHYD